MSASLTLLEMDQDGPSSQGGQNEMIIIVFEKKKTMIYAMIIIVSRSACGRRRTANGERRGDGKTLMSFLQNLFIGI